MSENTIKIHAESHRDFATNEYFDVVIFNAETKNLWQMEFCSNGLLNDEQSCRLNDVQEFIDSFNNKLEEEFIVISELAAEYVKSLLDAR